MTRTKCKSPGPHGASCDLLADHGGRHQSAIWGYGPLSWESECAHDLGLVDGLPVTLRCRLCGAVFCPGAADHTGVW